VLSGLREEQLLYVMPYSVMCRVSDTATGSRDSLLTRHGAPVIFGTIAEAEATAEDLRHERRHSRSAADYRYWVVECQSGDHAVVDSAAGVLSQ
jgi:hypothetical protein